MIELPGPLVVVWAILTVTGVFWVIIVTQQARQRANTLRLLSDPLHRTKVFPHHYGLYWAIKYVHANLKAKEYANALLAFHCRLLNSSAVMTVGIEILPREYQKLIQQLREEKILSRDWSKNPLPSLTANDIKNDNRKFIQFLRDYGVEI